MKMAQSDTYDAQLYEIRITSPTKKILSSKNFLRTLNSPNFWDYLHVSGLSVA